MKGTNETPQPTKLDEAIDNLDEAIWLFDQTMVYTRKRYKENIASWDEVMVEQRDARKTLKAAIQDKYVLIDDDAVERVEKHLYNQTAHAYSWDTTDDSSIKSLYRDRAKAIIAALKIEQIETVVSMKNTKIIGNYLSL